MMQRIGDVAATAIVNLDQRRKAIRQDRINEFGLDQGVYCIECGDTGTLLHDPTRFCIACEVGRETKDQRDRLNEWLEKTPLRFRNYTLDEHPDQQAVRQVREWLANGSAVGQTLVIFGPVGTGKTGLAIGALREVHLSGKSVHWQTVPDILESLRPAHDKDKHPGIALGSYQSVPLLMMDDLGAEKPTDWIADRIFLIINGRYERQLPTIVTTNQPVSKLEEAVGKRPISRLLEDYTAILVDGPDRRRQRTGGIA